MHHVEDVGKILYDVMGELIRSITKAEIPNQDKETSKAGNSSPRARENDRFMLSNINKAIEVALNFDKEFPQKKGRWSSVRVSFLRILASIQILLRYFALTKASSRKEKSKKESFKGTEKVTNTNTD
eukprot:Pgem_evm1s8869